MRPRVQLCHPYSSAVLSALLHVKRSRIVFLIRLTGAFHIIELCWLLTHTMSRLAIRLCALSHSGIANTVGVFRLISFCRVYLWVVCVHIMVQDWAVKSWPMSEHIAGCECKWHTARPITMDNITDTFCNGPPAGCMTLCRVIYFVTIQ